MLKLMTKPEVAAAVGVHPETITRWAREGSFPAPVKLGRSKLSATRFVENEVAAWLEARVAEREPTANPA